MFRLDARLRRQGKQGILESTTRSFSLAVGKLSNTELLAPACKHKACFYWGAAPDRNISNQAISLIDLAWERW
jgi:hypothetical protein